MTNVSIYCKKLCKNSTFYLLGIIELAEIKAGTVLNTIESNSLAVHYQRWISLRERNTFYASFLQNMYNKTREGFWTSCQFKGQLNLILIKVENVLI